MQYFVFILIFWIHFFYSALKTFAFFLQSECCYSSCYCSLNQCSHKTCFTKKCSRDNKTDCSQTRGMVGFLCFVYVAMERVGKAFRTKHTNTCCIFLFPCLYSSVVLGHFWESIISQLQTLSMYVYKQLLTNPAQ